MFAAFLVAGTPTDAAQLDPAVRDRVVAAAVRLAVLATERVGGAESGVFFPVGSGAVVSPAGHVLTNQHVIDDAANRAALARSAARQGSGVAYELVPGRFLVLVTGDGAAPEPRWQAEVVEADAALDLAVLRVVADADGAPVAPDGLRLPFVPPGNSDALQLGDPLDVFAYPAAGGDSLTYTAGVVAGFVAEEGVDGRAWIKTDAVLSGGSSGGAAVDRAGRLVGVPTRGAALDCRPGDTNGDGSVDAADAGCVPTGGAIGELRPVNLAIPLLARAGALAGASAVEAPAPTATPTPRYMPMPVPAAPAPGAVDFVIDAPGWINVRAGPGLDAAVVTTAAGGTTVVWLDDGRDAQGYWWSRVRLPDGTEGWVLSGYLQGWRPS